MTPERRRELALSLYDSVVYDHDIEIIESAFLALEKEVSGDVERLRSAIRQTLDANGHLADGDVCTLLPLKLALRESGAPWDGDELPYVELRFGWLDVETVKPRCPRDPDALGESVLIWPRNPAGNEHGGVDGHAYYGRRATGRPAFYKHGAEIHGVTHWMPMPKGPNPTSSPENGANKKGVGA